MSWDFVVVGSGFGGSVSALRLAQKGWRVLVIEKGRRFAPSDFPKNNMDLRNWLWNPSLGLKGIFQMSFMEHVTALHGVGVGGGSLVYANTLPMPTDAFFEASSWSHLADWKTELAPHYAMAKRMLGAAPNPVQTRGDEVLGEIAAEMGRSEHHKPTDVAVFFGESGKEVADPYFDGKGPRRRGCTFCGACMTGCRVGAKNTLDRNYLYLAEQLGVEVRPETEVVSIQHTGSGYRIVTRPSLKRGREVVIEADRVVVSGGVMGTVPLLLKLRADGDLPALSEQVGKRVRTNSEALFGVVAPHGGDHDYSHGVAITSILHTDDHSHIEPVRYGPGSNFFRMMALPHAPGDTVQSRVWSTIRQFARHPRTWAAAYTGADHARRSQVLLYMRTLEGTLSFTLGRGLRTGFRRGMVSTLEPGQPAPLAFMPEATELMQRFAKKVDGVGVSMASEVFTGVPTTAHVLGGACMGRDGVEGVIGPDHQVHGYDGLYVIDGAAMSANPGVNPSLTITAMAERAMEGIASR